MAVRSLPEYHSTNTSYVYVEDVDKFVQETLFEMPEYIAVDTETYFDKDAAEDINVITRFVKNSPNNIPFGVSMFWGHTGYWIDKDIHKLRPVLEALSIKKILHNAKYDMFMFNNIGMDILGEIWDTMIMIKLIDEEFMCKVPPDENGEVKYKKSNKLKDLSYHFDLSTQGNAHMHEQLVDDYRTIIARNTGRNKEEVSYKEVSDANHELMKDYGIADTDYDYKLFFILLPLLKEQDLMEAYEIDINATRAVIDIERNGIRVDVEMMKRDEEELTTIINNAIHDMARVAGFEFRADLKYDFNPNSDADIVAIFERLGIGVGGWSWFTDKGELRTDKKVMKEFQKSENKDIQALATHLLTYRKATKIRDTYITGVYMYIQSDGKIHPDFWVCPDDYGKGSTTTGRMSSSNPNFQNIPKKPIEFETYEED